MRRQVSAPVKYAQITLPNAQNSTCVDFCKLILIYIVEQVAEIPGITVT